MKLTLTWLKQYVDFPWPPEELAERLTMLGIEVEAVQKLAGEFEGIVVAQVITRTVRPRVDFVGHVGGDDFVFLLRSEDWSLRLTALLEELGASLVNFHSSNFTAAGVAALASEWKKTRAMRC